MLDESVPYTIKEWLTTLNYKETSILEDKYNNIIYTGTGRFALRLILDYYRKIGEIQDKNTQILVPKWMCMSVYHTFHKVCFPVVSINKNTKGLFVYHQYGFPQNMDEIMGYAKEKKMFVIENCVNVIESYYNGKLIGSFGDASIFSFSKMFPSIQGGALVLNNKNIINNIDIKLYKESSFIFIMSHLTRILSQKFKSKFGSLLEEMIYGQIEKACRISNFSKKVIMNSINEGFIENRRNNYYQYLKNFENYDFFNNLEREVVPYVVPFFANEILLNKIKSKLIKNGINTNIYNFDVNRNLLNPNFNKCLWLPVHQKIDLKKINKISNIIKSTI